MINQLLKGMKPPSANPHQVIPATQLLTQMRQMVGLEEAPKAPSNPFNTPVNRQSVQPTQDMWKPVNSSASERAEKEKKQQEAADKFQNSPITKSLGLDESFFNSLLDEVDNPDTPFSIQDAEKYVSQHVTDKIDSMSSKDFKQGGF
ncbi:hypothetical protein C4G51_RS18645 [Vibrio parahaemolyticus]|nr:hypothetical protein [Vibrio parahaemolyticus]